MEIKSEQEIPNESRNTIWERIYAWFEDDQYGDVLIAVLFSLFFFYLFFSREKLRSENDLIPVNGTFLKYSFDEIGQGQEYYFWLSNYKNTFRVPAEYLNFFNEELFANAFKEGNKIFLTIPKYLLPKLDEYGEVIFVTSIASENVNYLEKKDVLKIEDKNNDNDIFLYTGSGALIFAIVLFYYRRRKIREKASIVIKNPGKESPNDKIISINNVTQKDLIKVLIGFCKSYNEVEYRVTIRLFVIAENEFVVTFPYDVDFEIFCFAVNYFNYPIEIEWESEIIGWCATKPGDNWITEENANKKVLIYVPFDDEDYDCVYVTTAENIGYKFMFNNKVKRINESKLKYIKPIQDFEKLKFKEHQDFE